MVVSQNHPNYVQYLTLPNLYFPSLRKETKFLNNKPNFIIFQLKWTGKRTLPKVSTVETNLTSDHNVHHCSQRYLLQLQHFPQNLFLNAIPTTESLHQIEKNSTIPLFTQQWFWKGLRRWAFEQFSTWCQPGWPIPFRTDDQY